MQPGREMGERGRRLGEWWAILQSNISFAINPIWIDFPPSHALRNSAQMLFFYGVSKWQGVERDTERGRGEEGTIETEGKRHRKGDHGVQHLFDCYLGATVSNYCLEPLKKLITGSHRLHSRRTDLVPGTTQLSPLTTTQSNAATSRAAPECFNKCEVFTSQALPTHRGFNLVKIVASLLLAGLLTSSLKVKRRRRQTRKARCRKEGWREKEIVEEGADHLFPVFSQLQAWRSYFCWFTAFLDTTTSERGIIRRL